MKPSRTIQSIFAVAFVALSLPMFGASSAAHAGDSGDVLRYVAPARAGPIRLLLQREGDRLVIREADAIVASLPFDQIAAVSIGGPDRTDTELTVDYSGGGIAPPIDFSPGNLGPSTINTLTMVGGSAAAITHQATGPHDGVIHRDGAVIRYANLTPVNDALPSGTFTFTPPTATRFINIVDGPGGTTQINDGGTGKFELLNLSNKQTIVVYTSNTGSTMTLDNPTPANGLTRLVLMGNGVAGANEYFVKPYANIPVTVHGTDTLGGHSDQLRIDAAGAINPALAVSQNPFGFAGIYTFSNRAPVYVQGMTSVTPAFRPPCTLDVDGNSQLEALNDGLILLRALFNLTGTAVTDSALGSGATRNTWPLIRSYLNSNCGSSFSP